MFDFNEEVQDWTLESLNSRLELLQDGELLRIENLPNEIYHASNGISTSMIKKFIECPYLYYAHFVDRSVEFKEQSYFAFGDAGHTTILEPNKFDSRYVRQPDSISTRNGAAWDIFDGKAKAKGKKVLTAEQWDAMPKLKKAIDSHPSARKFLSGGSAEVSYYTKDKETGFIIKCRADYEIYGPKGLVLSDLKTSDTVDPRFIPSKFKKLGYHIQDAIYSHITGAAAFVFVAIQSSAPYIVTAPVIMSDDVKKLGYLKFRKALREIKECYATGVWPMYTDKPLVIELSKFEQDELNNLEGVSYEQ
jgi:hypothetical protein